MLIGFKNKAADASLTAKLISFWTRSEWVHCEMIFESTWGSLCLSARPGEVAVSARLFGEVVVNADHWEFYRVPGIDAQQEQAILAYLFAQSVTEYSYSGIIWSQVFGMDHQAAGQWFCSELTYSVLWNFSEIDTTFVQPANWSPAELRQLVKGSCVEVDKQSLLTS